MNRACHAQHQHTNTSTSLEEEDTILLTSMFDRYSHARVFATPKIVIDIYAGDMSMAKYYLKRYQDCIAICYDVKSRRDALDTVPRYLHPRIVYVERNVCNMSTIDIEREVRKCMPGASMQDVYHIHASPDCRTMSTAECRHDRYAYRLPDGSPNPDAPEYRRRRVESHDRALNNVLNIMTAFANRYPRVLQTIENPQGAFALQPKVRNMIDSGKYRLLETHYCAAADPRIDHGMWSMKPTHILIHGACKDLVLPQCNLDCQYLIPGTRRHLMSIRIDRNSHPKQQRVTGHMRHAIPSGLFRCIHNSHDDSHESMPHGLFQVMDISHSQELAHEHEHGTDKLAVKCKACHKHTSHEAAADSKAAQEWLRIHARYGHQSDKRIGLKKLKGLTKVRCPTCLAAKMCRKSHSGKLPRASHALELVYTDLQEFRQHDLDGNKYQAIFVDDKTDRKWCYLVKQKSDYSEVFKLWLSEVGVPPTRMRSDWGGEFRAAVEHQFLKVCLERGIWPEKSAPYSPEQNKAERGNRTLLEIARSIMLHKRLPKQYWGYAMKYACYIDMHCHNKRVGMTPYKAWHGYDAVFDPPVFGSEVYFRHNERGEDKLDATGHRARFLGFPTDSPGCYVQDLDHKTKPVRISYDVPIHGFDEAIDSLTDEVLVDKDYYELIVPKLEVHAVEAFPLVGDDRLGVPKTRIEYWHALQKFADEKRKEFTDNGDSEASILSKISGEWKERQIAAASELKYRIDSDAKHANVQHALQRSKRTRIEEKEVPVAQSQSRAPVTADTRCEKCNSPEDEANMLLCDNCDRGYHMRCIGMSKLPAKSHGWLCNTCLTPQTRISVFRNTDKVWHDGTITMQYPNDGGHDIEYDDGCREHANLNHRKWKPVYEATHAVTALYTHMSHEDMQDGYFVYNVAAWCPKTHNDILKSNPQVRKSWLASEDKEWSAILNKGAIRIIPLANVPRKATFVPCKWAYKVKSDGTLKSRLCILGNRMPESDFETSAPTPRMSSVRILLKLIIEEGLDCHILDLTAAFLNAPARGQTYLRLPPGRNKPGFAALLLRNLYGSTHAPRAWHNMLHNWFTGRGFKPNPHDPCIYSRFTQGSWMHALVHVDDICYSGTTEQCNMFRKEIEAHFKVDYLGRLGADVRAKRYLGVQVERKADRFILHNDDNISKLLQTAKSYNLPKEDVPMKDVRLSSEDCPSSEEEKKSMSSKPYRQLLGQIGFICISTRPDCCYAYKELARFSNNFGERHWQALLSLVGYMRETRQTHRLHVSRGGGMKLRAWSDADWNGEKDKHLSTTGWITFIGDSPISWCSRMQRCTSKSTAESEYVAASSCTQEVIYLQMLLASLSHPTETVEVFAKEGSDQDPGCIRRWREWTRDHPDTSAIVNTDSMNAIANASMPPGWLQETLRHIKTHFHFVKQFIQDKSIALTHCSSEDQRADIFTKGFGARTSAPGNNQKAHSFRRLAKMCLGM